MKYALGFIAVFIIIALPIFAHLDDYPIQIWDESRLAVNAFEMLHAKNYMVTTYLDKPDMWNTKPPLLIWLHVLFLKMFGVNELAIRLPSAIAAVLTCFMLYRIFAKKFNNIWLGILTCFVLITADGYVDIHAVRTGDYDALLTLFTTGYLLMFFFFFHEQKNKYLYWAFILLALAALTKGIAAFIFLPGVALYALFDKNVRTTLKNHHFYLALLIFAGIVMDYYLLREYYNAGYVDAVIQNEISGRYNEVIESHDGGPLFYLEQLSNTQFKYWFLFLPLGMILGLLSKEAIIRKFTLFAIITTTVHFLVLTWGGTKLMWYTIPELPIFAAIVAIFIYNAFVSLTSAYTLPVKIGIAAIAILFAAYVPYANILNKSFAREKPAFWVTDFDTPGKFLKDILHHKRKLRDFTITETHQNVVWYREVLAEEYGVDYRPVDNLAPGRLVMASEAYKKAYIENNYDYNVVDQYRNVRIYYIKNALQ